MRNDMTWHTSSHSLLFSMLRIFFKQPSCCLGKFCGKASLLPLSTDFVKCWTPFSQSSLKNANRNWPCRIQTAHAPQTSAVICAKLLFLQAACAPYFSSYSYPRVSCRMKPSLLAKASAKQLMLLAQLPTGHHLL